VEMNYLLNIPARYITRMATTMPSNSPRILILRAHLLEMFISGGFIAVGLFMWLSMNGSNSGITLLAGAALLVAGVIVFLLAVKSILKYKGHGRRI
jgi:hypothetical protein